MDPTRDKAINFMSQTFVVIFCIAFGALVIFSGAAQDSAVQEEVSNIIEQ